MSFSVVIHQRPEGMRTLLTTVEMSTDGLQLKLIKDIRDVVSINGQSLTMPQKETLRKLGSRWEVTDLMPDVDKGVLVTARREGYLRTWTINEQGVGRFADGEGFTIPVTRQDPLNSAPWAIETET